MNKQGLLIVLSGPSGCGKGTVLKELLAQEGNIFLSTSATTRNPRPGEINGEHYFFLKKEEFERQIAEDGMLEYACYCGNYYGTPRKAVLDRCAKGENVILEIEVQGAMRVKEKEPDAVLLFVLPPSLNELKRRLVDRNTEDIQTVNNRLNTALEEMKYAHQYDYIVVNHTVSETAADLSAIIRSEQFKAKRMDSFVDEVLG